jgi:hypothetical protein
MIRRYGTGSENQELNPKLTAVGDCANAMGFRICMRHRVAEFEYQKALCWR